MWWLAALTVFADSAHTLVVPVAPGEELQVTVAGAGPPVVLVPGLFGAAFGFRKLIPLLTPDHRVIVVEPLGVGTSARPEHADYSLDAQADRVASVLDTLAVTRYDDGGGQVDGVAMQRELPQDVAGRGRKTVRLKVGPGDVARFDQEIVCHP